MELGLHACPPCIPFSELALEHLGVRLAILALAKLGQDLVEFGARSTNLALDFIRHLGVIEPYLEAQASIFHNLKAFFQAFQDLRQVDLPILLQEI